VEILNVIVSVVAVVVGMGSDVEKREGVIVARVRVWSDVPSPGYRDVRDDNSSGMKKRGCRTKKG